MRRLLFGLLVVAILSAAALGCSDDEDPDSAEQLYGTWDVVGAGSLHTFESDGSWYVVAEGGVTGDPYDKGTYTVDGSILTLDTDEDARGCPQKTGTFEVAFSDPDTMSLERIDDECRARGLSGPWVRVEED